MTFPTELKQIPQWVVWRLEERDGKPTKVPYRANGDGMAAVNAPATWASAGEAYKRTKINGYSGLGFVVTKDDPFCGIDLDHCRNSVTGEIQVWAMEIVAQLDSYTEITPSGQGLRVWVRATLPEGGNRKGDIEMYDHDRYFTATGQHLEKTPETIENRQQEVTTLHARLFPKPAEILQLPTSGLSAYDVIGKAKSASNGPKFDRLMRGDASDYPSPSEADEALCCLVAFYSRDPSVIEQVVRMSGLWDDKWDRRDYSERTINRALELVTDTYEPAGKIRSARVILPLPKDVRDVSEPWLTPLGTWLTQPEPQLDWLIDGVLIRGGVGVIGAKPKVGKTTLLHQLALSVARGVQFLNRKTQAGPVIYLALEEDRGRVIARFRALKATPKDEIHLLVGQAGPEGLQRLAEAIKELGASLAIVDPIQRLTRLENINDYSEVSNATDPLIGLARQTGCAILFSHHLGKLDRESGDQLLGSTALFGAVDTSVVIRKQEGGARTLETIQRYGRSLEPVVLGHDEETGAAWIVGPAEEYEHERDQVNILKALGEQMDAVSQTDLLEAVGLRWDRALRALKTLVETHRVQKLGSGRRGDPYRFRGLTKPEDLPVAFLTSNRDSLPSSNGGLDDSLPNTGNESGRETGKDTGFLNSQDSLPPYRGQARNPRLGCPSCGELAYSPGPAGLPERRCHTCGEAWTP